MTYVEPQDVVSPRARWKLIDVLRNEGPGEVAYALGEWDGEPSIGMRWNGDDEHPIGNPQSRGLPTWTMVEERMHLPIIQTLREDKQILATTLLGIKVAPLVELGVAHHPSGRYTLTTRVSGQRVPEDARDPALIGNMDKAEFYRAVYREIKDHLERGSMVVCGGLTD